MRPPVPIRVRTGTDPYTHTGIYLERMSITDAPACAVLCSYVPAIQMSYVLVPVPSTFTVSLLGQCLNLGYLDITCKVTEARL